MSPIPERLADLRALMQESDVDLYLVPSADEHQNEYVPVHRARREFLSGFSGSAGDLLVGLDEAWLFADGRYHLQAGEQIADTGITLVKLGAPGAQTLTKLLTDLARSRPGLRLGIDPMVIPTSSGTSLAKVLENDGGELVDIPGNLPDQIWEATFSPSTSTLRALPVTWTGRTAGEKVKELREDLLEAGATSTVVVKLDQIAWLFNLRSSDDIPYNPVFESFLIVDQTRVNLFLVGGEARLPDNWEERPQDLVVREYSAFPAALQGMTGSVLIDRGSTSRGVDSVLREVGCKVVSAPAPLEKRKSRKNPAEQTAQKRANLRASVVKTQALLWLRREVAAGRTVTEISFKDQIESLYAKQDGYSGLSFTTISATGANGAIVHYGDCSEAPLRSGDLFLVDSGAHIAGGTTDDTRTVSVGPCEDPEKRRIYTLVLKGVIACARQMIPEGTAGSALDAHARSALWNDGLNYDHGTGHGVGAFLNVHEGPFAICERDRRPSSRVGLEPDIVTSIEPGYYRAGWGGIRLENLFIMESAHEDAGKKWMRLASLTWVPFDRELIDNDLLDAHERAWLDDYHAHCIEVLSPLLSETDRDELGALIG